MDPLKRLAAFAALFVLVKAAFAAGSLPVQGASGNPVLLLELGSQPSSLADKAVRESLGAVSGHEGDASIQTDKDEVSSLHPGFGAWKVNFRFKLKQGVPARAYSFWARWKQGGEPDLCVQSFEIWAGPSSNRLERRAVLNMKPRGWDYAWISAEPPVKLKASDAIIEVRNSGQGHDAKVFDAFLLAPSTSLPFLPASGTKENPLILLDLGKSKPPSGANLEVLSGTATVGEGAQSLLAEKDEVQVFHPGFGDWGASFRFQLMPSVPPGLYRFYARYKSGGEVSQVAQEFTVKAGTSPDKLSTRADFRLTNTTPWEYQWLQAESTVTILPGDAWLQIDNAGKADGAKVFDAFLLKLETPIGNWMSPAQADARNRFLALARPGEEGDRLYVLDGKGDGGDSLFNGLASESARPFYQKLAVSYFIGPKAEAMAKDLNLPSLPATVLADNHYGIRGVLAGPKSEKEVAQFLSDPAKAGMMPVPAAAKVEAAKPLRKGMPDAWLVGGSQDGKAGVSTFGLDSETVLRPNPGQPYLSLQMMGGEMRQWRKAQTQSDGTAAIEAKTQHSYGWSRGTGYAQLYLHVDKPTLTVLHLKSTGIRSFGWLDGQPFAFADDAPLLPLLGGGKGGGAEPNKILKGLTTEGLTATAQADKPEGPKSAALNLEKGWHSLLIKLVMQQPEGESFNFKGWFSDQAGHPLEAVKTQLADPSADTELNAIAARLRPLIYTNAPANLPHPGEPLKLRVDLNWHPILEETGLSEPLPKFKAKLRLRLVDYEGKEIAVREIDGMFPGEAEADFGQAPEAGFYAVYASLHAPDGRLIMNYPADGFTVVRGSAEQRTRLDKKKLWNNDYYALADGDKSFGKEGGYFDWLERMGVFRSVGSYPGFDPKYLPLWEKAKRRGLQLFADSSGDSSWLNDNPDDGRKFMQAASLYTRYFKSTNEIDIRAEPQWAKLREPKHWVQRTRWEYEQAHLARDDAQYVGGSLVRPGEGDWFRQVLQLGLDQYQDAWDVHAYPQYPPRFGGPIGNGPNEDERGVLAAYSALGKNNKLPFWLGETGAKAMHGLTGRRFQAEEAAKIIAWANSRGDYLGVAFCIAHEYGPGYGRIWDYSMGHQPGEAALYTAGALIDGLPYRAFDAGDADIQASWFGGTFMVWRTDGLSSLFKLKLEAGKEWLQVNVVGHVQPLALDSSGQAEIPISESPVYVLTRTDYERLTRN